MDHSDELVAQAKLALLMSKRIERESRALKQTLGGLIDDLESSLFKESKPTAEGHKEQ